mmetsp:Transcript_38211/g.53046  ORF Transcript_38211/g.53046 Transcript_38211/m.53046 type:complete len:207 (-) Transcript_38211:109-729(-)|eukprot:CAMPEP_0196574528 /NCGR_PEP_ID=MMETSP1081-20130531/4231_1 /TAXON_ID=36882 /ORGANISM="Pyramimonas amylifera, Strain CCMP720" /LENGTH=206 /DNA_ID=CAMNT_0041892579 /DNA_START=42 /DNA_END=662 /DNA_ORIENTATION=-
MEDGINKSNSNKRALEVDAELTLLLSSEGLNLQAVQSRAEHLQKALQRALGQLEHNFENVTWQDMVGQLAVLNVQFHNLTNEIRPVLKHYSVQPTSVNAEVASALPVLLSVKLLGEMEEEEEDLLQLYQASALGLQGDSHYENLQKKIDQYNGLCERADSLLQTLRKGIIVKRPRIVGPQRAPGFTGEQGRQNVLLHAIHNGQGLL